jgi:hypothetical protein
MSYDNPDRRTYTFTTVDFGASANTTLSIPVPRGLRGNMLGKNSLGGGSVRRVVVSNITQDFAGATTDGGVQVGDGSDPDKYWDSGLVLDTAVDVGEELVTTDDGSKVDIEKGRNSVIVTAVANTGSGLAGIADINVEIDWF